MTTLLRVALNGFAPLPLARNLWQRREVVWVFTHREVVGRYRGSALGLAWSFFSPLMMLAVYTFAFGVVFKAPWKGVPEGDLGAFSLRLFAGLIAFNVFGEVAARAPLCISSVPSFVKKVIFPLEVLPVAVLGASLYQAAVSFLILALGALVLGDGLPWTCLLAPLVLLPIVLVALGAGWVLASIGVYLKDVSQMIGLLVQVMLFATPVFYSLESIPAKVRWMIAWNPLSAPIEAMRGLALDGVLPAPGPLLVALAVGLLIALLGHAWFSVVRRWFADVA